MTKKGLPVACSPDQRGFPIMHRSLACCVGLILGLSLTLQPLHAQMPPGTPAGGAPAAGAPAGGTPATAPPNQPAVGGQAPAGPGAGVVQPIPGGPLGPLAPGGNAPGGNIPGGMIPGGVAPGAMGPGVGNALPAQGAPAGTASQGATLPPGYSPPGAPPAIVTEMPKPRRTDEEMNSAEQQLRRVGGNRGIDSVLLSGDPAPANLTALASWAKLQVDRMAAAKTLPELRNVSANISNKLRTAASQQTNRNRQREFREALCKALTTELQDVLINSNLAVRIQAATLLGNLNAMERSVVGSDPAIAYAPAIAALLDGLEDTEEDKASNDALLGAKVAAVEGIKRIAVEAQTIDATLRYRAADVMSAELAKADTHYWYQMRLAEALAAINVDLNRTRDPVVTTALLGAIADTNRHRIARTAAAKALSRTPIPSGKFDADAAAQQILAMGRELALEYNRDPSQADWHNAFWNLVLAFDLAPQEAANRLPETALLRAGLPPAYQTAQQRLLPVLDFVLNQPPGSAQPKPIPSELLQPLGESIAAAPQ